jgi:signal transduction histidine kinase/ActR/RegA family two-component response regulator
MNGAPQRLGPVRTRLSWATALVIVLATVAAFVASSFAREVRDDNEDRLVAQRADAIAQVIGGLGTGFQSEMGAAAAYATLGSDEQFREFVDASMADTTEASTWMIVERDAGGMRPTVVVPEGQPTYFETARVASIDAELERAFEGRFVIAGIYGEGLGRRFLIASGVPASQSNRIVALDFPLLAAAAGGDGGGDDYASFFANVEVGLYVGTQPSQDGLIFATYEGGAPDGSTSATFQIGGQDVLVVVHPTAPLSGALADRLPTIILAFGLAIGALAAIVVEIARRRQRAAVGLAQEIQRKHEALEHAVAERERVEAGLREMQRKEAVGQLAGGIAHDFNNLLAVISGYAELAVERVDDPAVREDLREISNAAERGAALTRRLLLFAREETDGDGTADLNEVIRGIARLLERTVGEEIALVIDVAPSPAVVGVSASELEQILVNLVVNARQAITGSGLITVRTRIDASATHVGLEVTDDGAGMEEHVAAQAFEPLFSTRPRGEGTGLGLATVAHIAARAGGGASIDSAPGKGTSVHVVMPLVSRGDDVAPAAPAEREDRVTVLLIEDEDGVRRALRRLLEERGYRVHEATSGLDAITRYLDTCVPDLLVTDVIMPGGVSGQEVVERFRTRHPGLPVVYVSGYAPDLVADDDGGPMRILPKPFTAADLAAAVSGALEDRSRP